MQFDVLGGSAINADVVDGLAYTRFYASRLPTEPGKIGPIQGGSIMLFSRAFVGLLIPVCSLATGAHALQIRQTEWNGHHVLLATGIVEQGDAQRMAAALRGARPLPHGLPVILLNSDGGGVAEALKISDVFLTALSTPLFQRGHGALRRAHRSFLLRGQIGR
jgi:hypothetical protein